MEKEITELIENYPKQLKWEDVRDFDNFDERMSAVDCLVVNTIGVSDGFIEFIPDNTPPLKEEVLCWIWAPAGARLYLVPFCIIPPSRPRLQRGCQ